MKHLLLSIIAILFLASCQSDPNKQMDEGTITENIYRSKEMGWTMQIPDGWTVTHKNTVDERAEKGLEMMSESTGVEFDVSQLKVLLNLQKDQFHNFQSSAEAFTLEYEGHWKENNQAVRRLIYETYTNRGIQVDTSSSVAIIDKLEFQVFHITLYGPDGNVILYQDMYGRYINGHDFNVNLNYINDEEKNELLKAWKRSQFE